MNFIELFVETSREGLEPVSGLLYQQGVTGLIVEDPADFAAFLNNPSRDWDYVDDGLKAQKESAPTGITFYVSDTPAGYDTVKTVAIALQTLKNKEKELDLGPLTLSRKNVKEEDWANNWKQYFKPFPVGQNLLIRPSWEEIPAAETRKVLTIDPGHVFGTGGHETTSMCLEHLERWVRPGDTVFDIGCGSGILSIGALLLGAKEATAIDIDPDAVSIAYENAERNGIDRAVYHVLSGNITKDRELEQSFHGRDFDVVVANIVADVIIILCRRVRRCIRPGGVFIVSGIIQDRMEDVMGVLSLNKFTVEDITVKGEWAAMAARYEG